MRVRSARQKIHCLSYIVIEELYLRACTGMYIAQIASSHTVEHPYRGGLSRKAEEASIEMLHFVSGSQFCVLLGQCPVITLTGAT